MAKSFEHLKVFQAAVELSVEVYRVTERYPKHELYGLVSQLRRASVGIVSHIAEGQGRLTWGEWRQMLSDARGSLYETEAQLIVSERLGYITDEEYAVLRGHTKTVGGLLAGLIRYVVKHESSAKTSRSRNSRGNSQPATG